MTTEQRIIALAQAIGGDVKTLTNKIGDLTSLTTTAKGNIVAAINELHALVGTGGVQINDAATDGNTTETWSANKIFDTIEAAKLAVKSDLQAGAGAALDTFAELQVALNSDPNFASTIATGLGNRVRFDAVQTLDAAQKLQACTNIGIGDPDHNYLTEYNAAKV